MPRVRGVPVLYDAGGPDGFGIDTTIPTERTLAIRRTDIPSKVRQGGAAKVEAHINATLATFFDGHPEKALSHVFGINPLNVAVIISTRPIPDGWWVPPPDDGF